MAVLLSERGGIAPTTGSKEPEDPDLQRALLKTPYEEVPMLIIARMTSMQSRNDMHPVLVGLESLHGLLKGHAVEGAAFMEPFGDTG